MPKRSVSIAPTAQKTDKTRPRLARFGSQIASPHTPLTMRPPIRWTSAARRQDTLPSTCPRSWSLRAAVCEMLNSSPPSRSKSGCRHPNYRLLELSPDLPLPKEKGTLPTIQQKTVALSFIPLARARFVGRTPTPKLDINCLGRIIFTRPVTSQGSHDLSAPDHGSASRGRSFLPTRFHEDR